MPKWLQFSMLCGRLIAESTYSVMNGACPTVTATERGANSGSGTPAQNELLSLCDMPCSTSHQCSSLLLLFFPFLY